MYVCNTFRRLRCPRNVLHMHLFLSFILRAILTLLKDSLFARGAGLASDFQNNWGCKIIISLWEFSIMSNYSWILIEGLPLLNVIPWVVVRAELDDTLCWTTYNNRLYSLIMEIPVVIFMGVNFILFLNIVRVLRLKLTASISEENRRYRKWAKSTLVLVPLFGVHSVLFIWMSYLGDTLGSLEIVWLYIDQLFNCCQVNNAL
ncbi:hypothetical protein AAG570_005369 [Ranatra chinensis]|uniref:G-protein coupled receptors family 2 profile 2 domain-containing protein n=1 Tax=Ranatra chinensis TaxID=642074 RepID=A0ABD0YNU2_9HEMI